MIPNGICFLLHDSGDHSDWVLQIATRLRSNGVNAILDRWNLHLGQNLAAFIEKGFSNRTEYCAFALKITSKGEWIGRWRWFRKEDNHR